jgi:hypothetical protein
LAILFVMETYFLERGNPRLAVEGLHQDFDQFQIWPFIDLGIAITCLKSARVYWMPEFQRVAFICVDSFIMKRLICPMDLRNIRLWMTHSMSFIYQTKFKIDFLFIPRRIPWFSPVSAFSSITWSSPRH